MISLPIKIVLSVLASIITIISYFLYIRSIFLRKTKTHAYTWLIWGITQGTAAVAMILGGAMVGSLAFIVGTILVLFVFFLSLKYGFKDITKFDSIMLFLAFLAIVFWWFLDAPLVSIYLVSLIDVIGYIPTIRKTYREPESETYSFWFAMVVVNILILLSLYTYNIFTLLYPLVLLMMNIIVLILVIVGRKNKKPH